MATDAASLLAQANCYACFGIGGTNDILELALVAQWTFNATTLINLIPAGSHYSAGGGVFTVSPPLLAGHTYQWVKNANDIQLQDNGNSPLNNTGTFVADGFTVTLFGTPSALITAQLFKLN